MLIVARINAIWRVPLALLLTSVLATFSVLFSLFDATGRLQHLCARLWGKSILLMGRVRVEVVGLEKLNPERGYVFAANHLSMFDHWAFLAHLPFQFRFVAKESLFRIPFLGWHLKRSGNIPVRRHHPVETVRSLHDVSERIRLGISFVIYPEGMRTWGEAVAPFKRGAFFLAREAAAPIVPVTILGAHERLPRGSMVIRPGLMRLVLHEPIEYEEYKDLDLSSLAQRVRETIVQSYRQVS